jgi:histidine triad (HIT) family protein
LPDSCFFCRFISGIESDWNRLDDIVLRTERTTAFISPRWWPNNHGHVIVVPHDHVADIESIDDALLAELYVTAKRIARGMRVAYACEGTSTRQHNGADAGQEVDHLHVHVFPRYANDQLYARNDEHRFAAPAERALYAEKLRSALETR